MNELMIAENKSSTALVVGRISRERRLKFVSDPVVMLEYKEQVKRRLLNVISRGYASFLFCSWRYFEKIVAECLEDIQVDFSQYTNRLCLMAVLPNQEFEDDLSPPENNNFLFVIYRDEEAILLTENEVITKLLDNTTILVYDNAENNPLITFAVRAACEMGVEAIDLNEA